MARRAWRILPTYWAALAFSCIVVGLVTPAETGDQVNLKAIVVHGLLLQDVVDSPKPNGAFWSIAVEWQIYFLFPLFLLLLRRTGPLRLASTVTVAVVVGYLLANGFDVFARFLNITPQYVALFAMGMAGAAVVASPPARRRRVLTLGAGALGLVFVVLCLVAGPVRVTDQYFWVDLLVGSATALMVAGLAAGGGGVLRRVFVSRPLAWVGRFSYSVYCIHAPLIWMVWHFVVSGWDLPRWLLLGAYLGTAVPTVLAVSWAFYLVFEKPFLTRRSWAAWRSWVVGLRRRAAPDPLPAVTSELG
jgi:peptidoglycan/LPS O-acetylase OafA/YrhL